MRTVIGIDLGTTNSVASWFDGKEVIVIQNDRGKRITPSVVAFTPNGDTLVGEAAVNQAMTNPDTTFFHFKRHLSSSKKFPLFQASITPEALCGFLLRKIRYDAESFIGKDVEDIVVTVPAHFSELQRRSIHRACVMAGLKPLRILNEPTAAALAYASKDRQKKIVFVYDLGGGTFDITLLRSEGHFFKVVASNGENHLGGVDFNNLILEKFSLALKRETGIILEEFPHLLHQVRFFVESAKIDLSTAENTTITLPFLNTDSGPQHFSWEISRRDFEKLIESYIEKTFFLVQKTMEDAEISRESIDSLILSGGSCRIPFVRKKISEFLGIVPESQISPEEVVSVGAAVYSDLIQQSGEILIDCVSMSFGLEVDGDRFVPLIPQHTELPAQSKKTFTTIVDNQEKVEIHVLQGDKSYCSENISLGCFFLENIQKGPKGGPRIDVVFSIDRDGILSIKAWDQHTGSFEEAVFHYVENLEDGGSLLKRRLSLLVDRIRAINRQNDRFNLEMWNNIDLTINNAEHALHANDELEMKRCQIALEGIVANFSELVKAVVVEN